MRQRLALLALLSLVGCEWPGAECVGETPLEDCPGLPFSPAQCPTVYAGSHMTLIPECAGSVYGFRLGRAECDGETVEVWCEQ
jgi:hypothetical protein